MKEFFDANGVLLRYEDDRPLPPITRIYASDRLRGQIIEAAREIRYIEIMVEHLDLNAVATERFWIAVHTIEAALSRARDELFR